MEYIYLVSAILLGVTSGIFTGLTPGIHVNTIAAITLSLGGTAFLNNIDPMMIVLFIASLSITHTFFDVFPSLFLGIPGDESFSLLPGHQMVKEGRGEEALYISVMGSWFGLVMSLAIVGLILSGVMFFDINIIKIFNSYIKDYMFWILLFVSIVLILTDTNKVWALIVFLFSGLFGVIALGSPLINNAGGSAFNVMFPALAGLFGVSGLIQALFEKEGTLPKQQKYDFKQQTDTSYIKKESFLGSIGGMIVGLLPGLGSANAATMLLMIQSFFSSNKKDVENGKKYLVSVSALNTADVLFSLLALYLIERSRSGASVAIEQILSFGISLEDTIVISMVFIIAAFLAKTIIFKGSSTVIKYFSKIQYKPLTLAIIVFISLLVLFATGVWGIVVLITATLLGMVAPVVNVRRAQAMAFFLVPLLIFLSGFQAKIYTVLHLETIFSVGKEPSLQYITVILIISCIATIATYKFSKRYFRNA